MRKRAFSYIIALSLIFVSFAFLACENKPSEPIAEDYFGENDIIADFTLGLSDDFRSANWRNSGMFDCTWRRDNVRYNAEKKVLELVFDKTGDTHYGGEYRSNDFFGYGYYSVVMKPVSKVGIVSSFFTYTGRSDGNPHDEIDIEFLGKDTTKVQFNYFTNGVGGHEYLYELGFDASKDFHEYGFRWAEDSIIWYVDGKAVHKATENIPSTEGKIMINGWPGKSEGEYDVSGWLGVFDGVYPIPSAEYKWIAFKEI